MKYFFATLFLVGIFFANPVFAQEKFFNITSNYQVVDQEAVDGDILVSSEQGLVRAKSGYSINITGVLNLTPLVIYQNPDNIGQPVSVEGEMSVNVTTINGDIKVGDYITSSEIFGKGQKADHNGFMLGVGLENLQQDINNTKEFEGRKYTEGRIKVLIRPGYVQIPEERSLLRLIDIYISNLLENVKYPDRIIAITRYLIAGLIIILSFLVAFFVFIRSAINGIQAIGRNPLAKRAILLSISLNIVIALIILFIGLVAGLFILNLP